MRVFYAHPSGTLPAQIINDRKKLKKVLKNRGVAEARVRSGRDDYTSNWKGDWEAWQHSVVYRKDQTTQKAVYSVFIVSGTLCGRATAGILRLALSAKKPVFWWDGQEPGKMHRVQKIEEDDCENWTEGWRIVYKQPRPPEQIPLPF